MAARPMWPGHGPPERDTTEQCFTHGGLGQQPFSGQISGHWTTVAHVHDELCPSKMGCQGRWKKVWWEGGGMVDGRDSAWRNRAPANTARQAMDGLWTEARGQPKQSNDPGNNLHIINTPIIGRR